MMLVLIILKYTVRAIDVPRNVLKKSYCRELSKKVANIRLLVEFDIELDLGMERNIDEIEELVTMVSKLMFQQ